MPARVQRSLLRPSSLLLGPGMLVVLVLLAVIPVVVIAVAHFVRNLIQYEANDVGAHPAQGRHDGGDGFAVGLASEADDHYTVHASGDLERLGEAEEGGASTMVRLSFHVPGNRREPVHAPTFPAATARTSSVPSGAPPSRARTS